MTLARDLLALVARRGRLDPRPVARLENAAGSAAPLAALAAAEARSAPVLVVVPSEEEVRSWVRDLTAVSETSNILQNPPLDVSDEEVSVFDAFAALGERLRVLRALIGESKAQVVVTSVAGLLERVPGRESVERASLVVEKGGTLDPADLARSLIQTGLRRVPLVEGPGEFALRGGLVDVFPVGAQAPVRIELFGDEVESLRSFEPGTQRSTEELERVALPLIAAPQYVRARRDDGKTLLDHLPEGALVFLVAPSRLVEKALALDERTTGNARADLEPAKGILARLVARERVFVGEPLGEVAPESAPVVDLGARPADAPRGSHKEIADGLGHLARKGERVTVVCLRGAERERLREILQASGLEPESAESLRTGEAGITLAVGTLEAGFRVPDEKVVLVTSSELLGRYRKLAVTRVSRRHAAVAGKALESFADLEEGEAVVHVAHGVALFRGLVRLEREGRPRDHLALEFDDKALLYVPAERIGLVRRYVGPGGAPVRLSKLGGQGWQKRTHAAERAVRDLASDLLAVQAARRVKPGTAFPPDDDWQREFEASFPFVETEDQVRATDQVKTDMISGRAMDRLLCGDVGYGKTEVAMRAAFKAAAAGKQVAVLVPTTILAMQHAKTFKERMSDYPIRVDVVSRFRTKGEQKRAIDRAKAGDLDILIGTHRLLSKDVSFKDLGLIIVDEEQRFGVEHKERLKSLRQTVDVLTLSATPIPRTLHMALSGAREISTLTTPPEGRVAVETKVVKFERAIIKRAIERELSREGQVFLVHDRVNDIEKVASLVQQLVPHARVLVAHGQLPEEELEDRMMSFVDGVADVLVATTIVESGLDIPRANTLIVNRADRFGLADLHQLRGRVGRTRERAYAYFLLPEKTMLSDIAAKRLRAIEEFDELGAGFKIAMRDLEIRGAGNVLGAEQSGHIANVGYDLYCRLLKRAVDEMRGAAEIKAELDLEHDLDLEAGELELSLDVAAYVPDNYVEDVALKIECYRKLSSAVGEDELVALQDELKDRYGSMPDVLSTLFDLRRLRVRAASLGVERIWKIERVAAMKVKPRAMDALVKALWRKKDALRVIDERTLYLVLKDASIDDEQLLKLLLKAFDPAPPPPEKKPPEMTTRSRPAARKK
jgi:transcription-repair coupling factor (superfamily II helicase)